MTAPLATGLVTDRWFHSPNALPQALVAITVPVILEGFLCSLRAVPAYDVMRAQMVDTD